LVGSVHAPSLTVGFLLLPQVSFNSRSNITTAGGLLFTNQIVGKRLAFAEKLLDGSLNRRRCTRQSLVFISRAQPIQHHLYGEDRRQRVRFIFAGVLGSAAVNRFKHGMRVADVSADG